MGYNLNRLKNQYGVSTASKAQYAGQRNPGAEFSYNPDAEAAEAAQRATYDANKAKFEADKAAYDAYSAQYSQRMQGTPMYANKQYQTQKEAAPNTINEMYQKYLGRENENDPARAPGSSLPDWMNAPPEGSMNTMALVSFTNPITGEEYIAPSGGYSLNKNATQQVSDAERNAFLRNAEAEFIQRGINNTGNQNVMNQSGKYYGNVLKNPIYSSSSTGVQTEDANGAIIGSDLTSIDLTGIGGGVIDINNLPGSGYEFDADGQIIFDGVDGFDVDDLNLDDITIDMSENNDGANTSVTNSGDNTSYATFGDVYANQGIDVTGGETDTEGFFSGGGEDGIGNFGVVGDFFGGIGDALNITNYDGSIADQPSGNDGGIGFSNSDEDNEGSWSWSDSSWNPSNWQEGGHIRGYAEGDPVVDMRSEVLTDEEIIAANDAAIAQINNTPAEVVDIETVTDVTSLDDLAAEQIIAQQTSGSNIDELRTMLATSDIPSAGGVSSARGALDTARADFSAMLKNAADTAGAGPSESEKWFRLAAAFGAPTQSGHFMENLGLANRELADVAKDRRAAGAAKNALLMEGAQFNIEYLKEDLLAATASSALERDYKRGLASDLLKWEQESARLAEEREFDLAVLAGERAYEDGKPQSEAAKIANDMGLEGTERAAYIKKYYEDKNAISALEIQSLNKNINSLSTGELNLKVETEGIIDSATDTLTKLDRALQLNSMAYTDSTWDRISQSVIGGLNPDDPNVVATQEMENILKGISLASLKSTFGGAGITDSERRSLDALQGANSKSEEVRAKIFREAAKTAATILTRQRKRLTDINTGTYGQKTTTAGDE